ncbi:alpha/beta hydrolase [Pseudoalteromonas luteoviolacea]|uniref:alpha/beta hydrolase n=1 Tax=Pseudoalteromonas luteoviolacea TaxID=43657 RepID=UPI001B377C9E|nr:alpha/beta hydrolase-fold protein [Pseudoalteromonas luteoviolacea]MBQ4836582.1 alpha/beta hydrolase [Pseudoalteromonas luteoviolacea]
MHTIIGLLLSIFCFSAFASYEPFTYKHEPISHTFSPNILAESKNVWVALPTGYHAPENAQKRYPVVYVTDGVAYQFITAESMWFANMVGHIPQAILVAIDTTEHRTRDLTPSVPNDGHSTDLTAGKSAIFQDFIKQEVVSFIDQNYRTNDFRVLAGHSLGGLFTITAVLNPQIQDTFKSYIALDPSMWWDNADTVNQLEQSLGLLNSKAFNIYIAAAHNDKDAANDTTGDYLEHIQAMARAGHLLYASNKTTGTYDVFQDETHMSILHQGLYKGLRAAFKCYPTTCDKSVKASN